jgi:GNAT superfamily N-acetyltransferase
VTAPVLRKAVFAAPEAQGLIRALDAELLARYPEPGTPAHFPLDAAEVAEGNGAFLLAWSAGKAIACGGVRRLKSDLFEVKRMYVVSEWRGRGLGRRVLRALEREARRLGAKRLVLETGPRQGESLALYESEGYAVIAPFGAHRAHPLSVFLGKDVQ